MMCQKKEMMESGHIFLKWFTLWDHSAAKALFSSVRTAIISAAAKRRKTVCMLTNHLMNHLMDLDFVNFQLINFKINPAQRQLSHLTLVNA